MPDYPKKRCQNCPKVFKPEQKHQNFCSPNCRKEYHKYGGAFAKVKAVMLVELKKRIRELSPADGPRIEVIEERLRCIEVALAAIHGSLHWIANEAGR